MVNCMECDKKLGLINRYFHPVFGKTHYVCNSCLMKIQNLLENWRLFIVKNPEYINFLKIDGIELKNSFLEIVSRFLKKHPTYNQEKWIVNHSHTSLEADSL